METWLISLFWPKHLVFFWIFQDPNIRFRILTLIFLVPQAPPTNLKNTTQFLTNMNEVEVQLQWDAIPVYLQGGNFSGYIIKYATSDEQSPPIYHPVGKNYVKLENLKPFRNYTVGIVGYNKIGNGEEEAVISFKTPEGS